MHSGDETVNDAGKGAMREQAIGMQERKELVWTSEQVARFWDYQSQRPSASANYFSIAHGAQIARRTLRYVMQSDSPHILDLGCGTGHLLKQISLLQPRALLYGIDFSGESIKTATETCGSVTPPPDLRVVDRYPTSLPADHFDVAYSVEVVEHLADDVLDALIAEAHRVLKPGGCLVITTPNREDLERLYTCCPNCNSTFHIWQHVRSWSTATLTQLMEMHGLMKVHATETLLEPAPARLMLWLARKLRLTKRSAPHILAIYRKPLERNTCPSL